MKGSPRPFPGRTAMVLLGFMTLLMLFPLVLYDRFSTFREELFFRERMAAADYGRALREYFEAPGRESPAEWQRLLDDLPLMGRLQAVLYTPAGDRAAQRRSEEESRVLPRKGAYDLLRSLIRPLRELGGGREAQSPSTIRARLLREAREGRRGVGYAFASGVIGDRVLYFSFPLWERSPGEKSLRGVLLLEYDDPDLAAVIRNQRNQFVLMILLFLILLLLYLCFIFFGLLSPLQKLLTKALALLGRRGSSPEEAPRKRGSSELREISRALDRMARLMEESETEAERSADELRHIIRNPLAVIRAALEGLMMERRDERDAKLARIIQNNLLKIDDYLSGCEGLGPSDGAGFSEPVRPDRLLEELIRSYTPLAASAGVRLRADLPRELPSWNGSEPRLLYALEQVINNAVSFSPEGGEILLGAESRGGDLRITVEDRGPGIPPGEEERIFGQYISLRPPGEGAHRGIGLYLARKTLRQMGGEIGAARGSRGGALFTLMLPTNPPRRF